MSLVENIKKACREKDMPIVELERKAGIAPASICKWDKSQPSYMKVAMVAAVLGIPFDELVKQGGG